jgi:3-oxoadipate enol-lactonase
MPEAQVNSTTINYEFAKDNGRPVLVLGNSLGCDLRMWDRQADAFGGDFRILRTDMRGHGRSAAPPGPYTIGELAKDVLGVADHLGVGKFYYCGLSMGGMIGQWLGMNAGARTEKLALCATSSKFPALEFWHDRIKMVREQGLDEVADAAVERWFTAHSRETGQKDMPAIRAMTQAADPDGYIGCCQAVMAMDFTDGLASIDTETLVVVGAEDPATTPEANQIIADNIPGARLEIIPGAAHLVNLEQTAVFNETVLGFLTG